jgi:sulfonate transport system substrate-binding protein
MHSRRTILALASTAPFALAVSRQGAFAAATLCIGYQKSGVLALLKRRGTLEQKLAPRGVSVAWSEFSSGPPLLEALGSGALDYGYTGDVPPIFAQAARADLVYVGATPSPGSQSAILVKESGGIEKVIDLKGKTLAFVRGSSAHNVAVSALASVGLTLKDVTVANLSPADAAAAFAAGSIDAWSIWDPYFALAEGRADTRVLTTAEGIVDTYSFLLANASFARANTGLLREAIAETSAVADWSQSHLDDTTEAITEITGVSETAIRAMLTRKDARFQVLSLSDEIVRTQQKTADTFFAAGLIPRKLDIRSAVWNAQAS